MKQNDLHVEIQESIVRLAELNLQKEQIKLKKIKCEHLQERSLKRTKKRKFSWRRS